MIGLLLPCRKKETGVKSLSEQGTHSLIKTMRCPTCGAPLTPSAESILTICNFCGDVTAESPVSPHTIIKPLPMQPPEGVGDIRKMELILVPFFEVQAQIAVDARGYQRRERTETKTVRRGGKTYTETKTIVEYRPWRVNYGGTNSVRFLARQEVTMFGAGELISSVARGLGGEPISFDAQYIKELASRDQSRELVALSPEWDQDEASKKAGETVYEAAYSYAKSQMHEVHDTKVNFSPISKPMLVHEPLLLVRRRIQGRSYRAAYHCGNGQLLREEQPIKNRRLMMFIAILGFLVTPILAQLGFNFYNSTDEEVWLLIIFLVLAVAFIVIGIILLVRSFKPHKIKSSGSGVSLFDFQKLVPIQQPPQQMQPPQQEGGQQSTKKFCSKCGDPLEAGQKFCEKCGHSMED